MDLCSQIQHILGIPFIYVKKCSDDEALCLVHRSWLPYLQKGLQVPVELQEKESVDENLLKFFFTSKDISDPSWRLVAVYCWQKRKGKIRRFSKQLENSFTSNHITYAQLIDYVTKTNYKNLWEQAWRKYNAGDIPKRSKHKQSFNDALQEILKRLYKTTRIEREDGMIIHLSPPPSSAPNQFSDFQDIIHPNLLEIFCAVESPQSIFLICEKNVSTLKDCLMFSPFVLSGSTIRPLFVVYQLLQALCSVHNSGLFMGPITLSSISIKENLWIQVIPLTCLYLDSDKTTSEQYFVASDRHLTDGEYSDNKDDSVISSSLTFKPADQNREGDCSYHELTLPSLVQDWVNGIISNYDYLIALNKLAGREKDNPRSHYVMPWIMDFSVPDGGWRDLSKSKFRLNKGDKQLDLIYESATEITGTNLSCSSASIPQDSAVMVAHHTSEVLADITYYVYKARRMPKSFLCHHVRQKWVPAEYPATIERLQEWTPDECIPEFFSDPTIFYSIHPDLSDLGVPSWCKSPEDFIKKHREALEGYHVSERLHHWIDLVFGYKLTGPAAVKSKNVCLPLVDHHTSIRNYGMVQLFSHPHPHKLNKCIFSRSIAPKTFRNIVFKVSDTKDSGDDETSSESIGKSGFLKSLRSKSLVLPDNARHEPRPENQTIVLPKDFNPLATLSHFESLFTFLCWAGGGKVGRDETNSQHSAGEKMTFYNQVKDLLVVGCLISEIAVASYCKTLPENAVLEERYSNILKLLRLHKQDVPRSFQKVIQLLLQVDSSYHQEYEEITPVPSRYPPVSASGLPLPSAHQLLLSHIHTIPFPHYFPDLYLFLLKLNQFTAEINLLSEITDENGENRKKIENLAEKMVEYAAEQLKVLLPLLNVEGIELLTPYLQEIFENRHTALLATWHLFGMVSQALGPQQTCSKLLTRLTKVFDTDKPSPKHLKLYHRTFLLQIIVGLGLHNFLIHFTTILIEAIGGCKDYSSKNSESDYIYMQNTFEPDVSKLEHMAEDLDECIIDDGDGTYDTAFRQLNSSQETLNVQSEINNDEDNEMFDLDVNEEVLKDDNFIQVPSQIDKNKEKSKSDDENDVHKNDSGFRIPVDVPVDQNNILTPSQPWDMVQDSLYSRSAPNLTSHLSEWMQSSTDESMDLEVLKKKGKSEMDVSSSRSGIEYFQNDGTCELGSDLNVSDVSVESMLWLAHRLGPVLTARYLTRNLLRMLTLCYDSSEKREVVYIPPGSKDAKMLSISGKWLKGDISAFKVLDCLSRIASLYGEQFIMLQYIKHIADLLNLCRKKVPATLESGLHGAMALLQHIVPYLSDVTLMDHLQDVIIKDILYLALRLISSLRLVYPGSGKSRTMITFRLLDVIYTIGLRIGLEMTRKHLSGLLQKFFSCFDKIYTEECEFKDLKHILKPGIATNCPLKEQALEEMRQTFSPEMAFLAYIPFSKLAGGIHMEKTLKNDDLIRNLCLLHDKNMASSNSKYNFCDEKVSSVSSIMTHHRDHSLGQEDSFVSGIFGKNVNVVGNRLDVHLGEESHLVTAMGEPVPTVDSGNSFKLPDIPKYDISLIKRKMGDCQRHLKGNWLAYWEHETGRSEKDYHFDFKQIKLQTFIGHSGTVRAVQVLDNENSFLTSSKDKTVKLWSLRSCGDGSSLVPCQWTYTQHRKSVFAVSFLDSLRLVGSCDSTVHIWDPFLGSCIKQLEPTKGSPITVLAAMPAPSMTFLAATTNSTVRFLDARTCRYMHEFKVSVGTTGLIRCLAVSPNGHWLAVGHSTGMLSVLDVRTGLLFGTWLGHEGEVLQLKAFNNSYFVTSSLDHTLTVWKFEATQAKCSLKGPMEPVTSLCFYGNEVISGTTGNRIGLHSSIDKKATYTSTRLRSDTFKGVLTAMALLPLNRLLLLGTDNGNVVLLS